MGSKLLIPPLLTITICGCDVYHTLSLTAPVTGAIANECIEESLRSIPEIRQVTPQSGNQYQFRSDSASGTIGWTKSGENKSITLLSGWLNNISANQLEADRQLLYKVYAALTVNCPQMPPRAEIREIMR
jgi:hypothetical protein